MGILPQSYYYVGVSFRSPQDIKLASVAQNQDGNRNKNVVAARDDACS
jgi:hypothetical protein